MRLKALHISDALRLLKDGEPHKLRLLKLSDGTLMIYKGARHIGGHVTRGNVRVKLAESELIRQFKVVALMEIDDLKVYM